MLRDLENFIAMKRKHEIHRETSQKRMLNSKDSMFKDVSKQKNGSQSSQQTQNICRDLTKWLQDNHDNFIEDF